jgi:uncharacterized protein (TIGR02145 family)
MKKAIFILVMAIISISNFAQQTGTFKDPRDGKVYKTVKIGSQTWMAENLAYKASSGCWAYKNDQSKVATYGYLYNWETAKNVAPAGWHLPSDAEWETLVNYLGGESVPGGKMKSTTGWNSPNTGATNESGFNALPAGYRSNDDGSFYYLGSSTYFWSSSPLESELAWARYLFCNYGGVHRRYSYRTYGCSVRLLKD